MGDGPDGVIVEMWEQAKELGLNIDELNPKLFGQVGERSLKTEFELMMRSYGITVEDLKRVERGEFDYGVHTDEFIEVDEVMRMKEKLDAEAAAAAKFAYNIWDHITEEELNNIDDDDDDDDDEDESYLLAFEVRMKKWFEEYEAGLKQVDEVEVVSRGAKRTNDGEIKKDGHVPTPLRSA